MLLYGVYLFFKARRTHHHPMLVGDTPRAAVRDIALRSGVQKDEKARAPTWCAKRDERTSAPILWAEVEATNCGGATPRVHMARCMAYASIAWARTTNINIIIFQSVCEGNWSNLRRCHSACPYGSSASEERRSCLQWGKPFDSTTARLCSSVVQDVISIRF